MGPIAHARGWSGSRIWEPKLFLGAPGGPWPWLESYVAPSGRASTRFSYCTPPTYGLRRDRACAAFERAIDPLHWMLPYTRIEKSSACRLLTAPPAT